jgi:hypothetical protein
MPPGDGDDAPDFDRSDGSGKGADGHRLRLVERMRENLEDVEDERAAADLQAQNDQE